jgi:hypothetical protein
MDNLEDEFPEIRTQHSPAARHAHRDNVHPGKQRDGALAPSGGASRWLPKE